MRSNIKEILSKHRITNPALLTELNELYTKCILTGKRFGMHKAIRDLQVNCSQEELFWSDVEDGIARKIIDPDDPFNNRMLDKLKQDYGIHRKNGSNFQSS